MSTPLLPDQGINKGVGALHFSTSGVQVVKSASHQSTEQF